MSGSGWFALLASTLLRRNISRKGQRPAFTRVLRIFTPACHPRGVSPPAGCQNLSIRADGRSVRHACRQWGGAELGGPELGGPALRGRPGPPSAPLCVLYLPAAAPG